MGKPLWEMKLKRKDAPRGEKPIRVFAFFENERFPGFRGLPERPYNDRPGVKAILMDDGTRLDIQDYWINVEPPYDRERVEQSRSERRVRDDAQRQLKSDERAEENLGQCQDCGDVGGMHMPSCPSGTPDDDIPFD